jgi:hypothetical protein
MKRLTFNEAYILHEDGSIFSEVRGKRLLKQVKNNCGYIQYYLKHLDGSFKWYKAHRLVAEYYINNPNNYNEVNHLDGNKENNHFTNLEWCTRSQNIIHSYNLGRTINKGVNHHNFGKKLSEATKIKLSEAKKGINHPKFKGYYCFNEFQFTTTAEAESKTSINRKSILRWSKYNKNGWYFKAI